MQFQFMVMEPNLEQLCIVPTLLEMSKQQAQSIYGEVSMLYNPPG